MIPIVWLSGMNRSRKLEEVETGGKKESEMRRIVYAASAALLAVTIACAPPVAQESADIAARSDAWEVAFNDQDVDALVAMYSDDARVLAPNAPMGQGEEAVRSVFQGMIDAGLGGELTTVETMAAGDLGYHVGTYALTVDGSEVDRGKFVEIWRKVGGEWKIASDMFNSDLPPAGHAGETNVFLHEVEDVDVWLAAWQGENSRHAMFAEHGVPNARVFRSADDSKQVGLVVDISDRAALEAFLESEEGAAAKRADGVIDSTMQVLVEVE